MRKNTDFQLKIVHKITQCLVLVIISILTVSNANAAPQVMSSGWVQPTGSSNICDYLGFLAPNHAFNGYHLGKDICNAANSPVYSIGKGEILKSESHGSYGCNGTCSGGTILARYKADDGKWFTVLYGHLSGMIGVGTVKAGKIIGYTRSDWSPPHLHFAIHPGKTPISNWFAGYAKNTTNTMGFVDPLPYLKSHPVNRNKPPSPEPPPPQPPTPPVAIEPLIIPVINNFLLNN